MTKKVLKAIYKRIIAKFLAGLLLRYKSRNPTRGLPPVYLRAILEMMAYPKKTFTLPELLLAMAILAFALSAIIMGFITCFVLNEINRNLTIASSHAQYQMEEVKNTAFGGIINDTINAGDVDWPDILEALPDEVMTVTVNPVAGTNNTLLNVNLTVSWNDRGLRARNLSLQTYIAN